VARDSRRSALLVVDMFNTYDFEDADALLEDVERVVPNMARLIERAREQDVLVLYVNDNYGEWNASRDELVGQALEGRGGQLLEPITPPQGATLIHKARHSVFYQTPLEYLLFDEDVGRLVLTGQVTEQCILYSALDAYLRHFDVCVPEDAVASIHHHLGEAALEMMRVNMDADTTAAEHCRLGGDG
jgi:nicotinamidase-related amidase